MKINYCYICSTLNVEDFMICDMCNNHYCEECSYTFSLHYQYQGSRCFECADQNRRDPLSIRERKINMILLWDVLKNI